ncbi:MAG: hypothetical protein SPG28_09315 [Alloprevotella sp.]|nr:hypothetical protein [Alloprevotella sp.]
MSRKIILRILKTILRIVKIILLIVGLETGYAERSRIFVQASAIELAHIAERSRKSQRKCQEKVRVYEPMSGQDKPVISDGFEMQTIHSQPV